MKTFKTLLSRKNGKPDNPGGQNRRARAMLAAALVSSATSAMALTVKAPCKEGLGWDHVLRQCSDVFNGTSGDALASPGYMAMFKQTVQNRVDDWYNHKDGTKTLPDSMVWCNLVDNPFVPSGDGSADSPGDPKNHKGDSCGKYSQITVELNLQIMMGCVVGGSWQTLVNNTPPNATVEASYMRSGQILANACYLEKYSAQVRAYSLQIADDSSCMSAAQDVIKMENQLQKYNALNYDVKCLEGWENDPSKIIGVTQGMDKNASQQICALRSMVEAGFAKLADCEINDKAIKKFMKEIGGEAAQEDLFHAIDKEITQKCGSECAAKFSPCGNIPTTATFSACVNTCYQQKLAPFMRSYLKDHFGSCE